MSKHLQPAASFQVENYIIYIYSYIHLPNTSSSSEFGTFPPSACSEVPALPAPAPTAPAQGSNSGLSQPGGALQQQTLLINSDKSRDFASPQAPRRGKKNDELPVK